MAWDRIKRWFSKGADKTSGAGQGEETPESFPELPWIAPADNPWGVPLLDVRPVTLHFLSTSEDPQVAETLARMTGEDGLRFAQAVPDNPRRVAVDLRFHVDPVLPDGVLFSPRQMEHKWALFLHQRRLLFVRSWTGQVQVVADVEHRERTLRLTHLRGVFTAEGEAPEFTARMADFLLRSHVLERVHPAPLPEGLEAEPRTAALWCMSVFGNQVHFATPAALHLPPPDEVLRSHSLLHIATARGDREAIARQLAAGVPFTALAGDGLAPLHWALANDGTDLLVHLLERGSPVDVRSAEGATPLMNAVQKGRAGHVACLLERGADANAADDRGFTALHRAAEMGREDCVRLLLERGARPDTTAQGHSPRSLARDRQHTSILRLLGG